MARLALEVYLKKSKSNQEPDEKKILSNLKRDDDNFINVYPYDNKSSQAILAEHKDFLCMAFRGTDEVLDWLDNANVFSTEALFGAFHRGFWLSNEDVWQKMNKQLCSLQKEKKRPIFITGHSLGGAMATVAAAKLVHEDKPFTSVYTFGQPRVMTRKTARIFNEECRQRFFRFHNNNDIVTRAPLRMMGYSHVGSYMYITEEKEIHKEIGFWHRFLDYVEGALEDVKEKGLDGIKDHDMKEYLKAIETWNLID